MNTEPQVIAPTLTPSIIYDDARRGIRWLTEVLGFTMASMYEAPGGGVAFAELVWRTGIAFVSGRPDPNNPWSKAGISSIALVAEDASVVQQHYERALAAGADLVRKLHVARAPAFPEGSYQFDVRDPEGNLWTMGTFQPRLVLRKP
jgi:uncharacterized glyoxalase superfamily protein PhnB